MGCAHHIAALGRNERGAAALEFALVAPVMLVLLLMGFDTARYAKDVRHIEASAASIGQMLSVSTTGQVAAADLQFYEDATMVLFPQVLQDSYQQGIPWGSDIGLTVSSVVFSGSAPSYTATVKWSAGTALRPCNVQLTPVADSAPPGLRTLPADVFGAGSLIVVDVTFQFRPTIASKLMSSLPIVRSFYIQPRYVSALTFTGPSGVNVNQC